MKKCLLCGGVNNDIIYYFEEFDNKIVKCECGFMYSSLETRENVIDAYENNYWTNYQLNQGEKSIFDRIEEFEFIIIDGGSTDGSLDIIKRYEDNISCWVSEQDKGVYNAMNKGIKMAKGEYLQFLNSGDSLINSDVLNKVFKENKTEDIIYGNLMIGKKFLRI